MGVTESPVAPSANTEIIRRRKLPKNAWKPGQSGNPKGRPKVGQSWGEVIKQITEMAPEEIARMVGKDNDLGRAFLQMPRAVQVKYLIVARTIAALMFEPNTGLLNTIMERVEGKVKDQIDLTSGGKPLSETDAGATNRAISTLADAIRTLVHDPDAGTPGAVDAAKPGAVAGGSESGG